MLFTLLIICLIGNIILIFKLSNVEAENLGKISSFKLELKNKEKEIVDLQRIIRELKYNTDVEV